MPELPEVETIARKLDVVLPGKVIESIFPYHPKSLVGDAARLVGLPIESVSRRSKIIRIAFPHHLNLLVHLKMTGQLIYLDPQLRIGGGHPTADWLGALPSKHTRVEIDFKDASHLFFNDQRLFGWLRVQTDPEVHETFAVLGPDINDAEVTADYLYAKCKSRSQSIKQVLMDNTVVAGVGNIYACDALNLARIAPTRPAKSLSFTEMTALTAAAKHVIDQGIELGGTTFDGKYVDIDGLAGKYQSVVRVYGRAGKPCLNCGHEIVKTKIGGRGTYYCPNCQI